MTAPVPITWADKIFDPDKITYLNEESAEMFRKDLAPGTCEMFCSSDEQSMSLRYICPCGCGRMRIVPGQTGEKVERRWLWNGSKNKPTLQPSILCMDGCRWHGFITDGVFTTC